MALTAGSAAAGTGLAALLFNKIEAKFGSLSSLHREPVQELCDALADAIVNYIKDNADVKITTSDSGLQTVGGTPTSGPLSTKTLAGAVD